MNKLDILNKQYNKWERTAYSFISSSNGVLEASDIVQEAYIKIVNTDKLDHIVNDEGKVNPSYMYLTIRSVATDYLRVNQRDTKRTNRLDEDENVFQLESVGYCEHSAKFNELIDKMNEEVNSWAWYDKQLFKLYKDTGFSMQKLSEETKISKTSIFTTLKNCKEKLLTVIGEDYYNYLRGI
jgi:RNA polymerase sigma factor (sigma-70 family)